MVGATLAILFLALPQPKLELRAEPALLYAGQLGRLELTLRLPPGTREGADSPRLLLPWLEGDMPGLAGELDPDEWFTAQIRQKAPGFPVKLGPAVWRWPEEKAAEAGERVFRLTWRFRCRPDHEGPIEVPAAALEWPGRPTLASTPFIVEVKPAPLPTQPLPAWRLGVGAFTVRTDLVPSAVQPGEEAELRLWVGGEGCLTDIARPLLARMPGWGLDRCRLTPLPETWSEDLTARCFRWRVQFRAEAGRLRLPAIPYAFFDPAAGRYVVAGTPPMAAEVEPRGAGSLPLLPLAGELPARLELSSPEEALAAPAGPRRWLAGGAALALLLDFFACSALAVWLSVPSVARRRRRRQAWNDARRSLDDEGVGLPERVHAALRRLEQAEAADRLDDERLRQRARRLWGEAETARYGPPAFRRSDLEREARMLLDAWKEAACS